MRGVYLYGILEGEHHLKLGPIGLPNGQAHVDTVPKCGLTAVVSTYDGPALAQLPQRAILQCLSVHQRVVECAMAGQRILPVKFGTLLASRVEVGAVLDRWHACLAKTLELVGDAVEIEVAVTWDLKRVFAEIGKMPEIVALAASVAGRSDAESMAVRVEIGRQVKQALDRRRAAYRTVVTATLLPLAMESRPNALLADELVANVAFLVGGTRLNEFYAGLDRLDSGLEDQLTFRCVGPLPPYSFATVALSRQLPAEIDAARRLLELSERASEQELQRSYYRLASRYHPDHHPDDPSGPLRFAALNAARTLLREYVEAQRRLLRSVTPDYQYDLTGATASGGLALTVRRSEPSDSLYTESNDHPDSSVA